MSELHSTKINPGVLADPEVRRRLAACYRLLLGLAAKRRHAEAEDKAGNEAVPEPEVPAELQQGRGDSAGR